MPPNPKQASPIGARILQEPVNGDTKTNSNDQFRINSTNSPNEQQIDPTKSMPSNSSGQTPMGTRHGFNPAHRQLGQPYQSYGNSYGMGGGYGMGSGMGMSGMGYSGYGMGMGYGGYGMGMGMGMGLPYSGSLMGFVTAMNGVNHILMSVAQFAYILGGNSQQIIMQIQSLKALVQNTLQAIRNPTVEKWLRRNFKRSAMFRWILTFISMMITAQTLRLVRRYFSKNIDQYIHSNSNKLQSAFDLGNLLSTSDAAASSTSVGLEFSESSMGLS